MIFGSISTIVIAIAVAPIDNTIAIVIAIAIAIVIAIAIAIVIAIASVIVIVFSDIGSIATMAVIAIAAIFVLPQVRLLFSFITVIVMFIIIIMAMFNDMFFKAIYWITGINLSTFSFSRSDDPDASGLVNITLEL